MRSALFIRMSATVFVQPLDLVKNRMQLSGKNENYLVAFCSVSNLEGGVAFFRL